MKVLVTGSAGQLGRELCRAAEAGGLECVGKSASELDITDAASVASVFAAARPDVVFNAAAWTAVDRAESEPDSAFRVNRDGAANIAEACRAAGAALVHYSTDYVFDGSKHGAWHEDDAPSPLNVYGASKLAGENLVREILQRHLVFRTSWLFSSVGSNFVKTMLKLAAERDELRIVADQAGKPTSARVLANLSLDAVARPEIPWGTYHVAQPPATTWHAFAEAAIGRARRAGADLRVRDIVPVTTSEFPTSARRPTNSVLDCDKFESTFELAVPDWHDALDATIEELMRE